MTIDPRLLARYQGMIAGHYGYRQAIAKEDDETSPEHLNWMLNELHTLTPDDKANRWLGFVQGILIAKGVTSVGIEREVTRPILTDAAREVHVPPPPPDRLEIKGEVRS